MMSFCVKSRMKLTRSDLKTDQLGIRSDKTVREELKDQNKKTQKSVLT